MEKANAKLIGYKSYDFNDENGKRVAGYTLFFALSDVDGVEGQSCYIAKPVYDNEKKAFSYGLDINKISVGALYNLDFKMGLDSKNNAVVKLKSITRVN